MKRCMLSASVLFLILLCAFSLARGEDVLNVDVFTSGRVTTEKSYLCVTASDLTADNIVLSVTGPDGLTYMRDVGACTGTFRSDLIYLNQLGNPADYRVSTLIDGTEYIFTVRRVLPESTEAFAKTEELENGAWAVILDGAKEKVTVPLIRSDGKEIGSVTVVLRSGLLKVTAETSGKYTVQTGLVSVTTEPYDCLFFGSKEFAGTVTELEQSIPISGRVPIYLDVRISVHERKKQ